MEVYALIIEQLNDEPHIELFRSAAHRDEVFRLAITAQLRHWSADDCIDLTNCTLDELEAYWDSCRREHDEGAPIYRDTLPVFTSVAERAQ